MNTDTREMKRSAWRGKENNGETYVIELPTHAEMTINITKKQPEIMF